MNMVDNNYSVSENQYIIYNLNLQHLLNNVTFFTWIKYENIIRVKMSKTQNQNVFV